MELRPEEMTHEEVMELLRSIPKVKKSHESMQLKLAIAIQKKRLELNMTQEQLVEKIKRSGQSITQATISKIESAEADVKLSTYEKVLEALESTIEIKNVHERAARLKDLMQKRKKIKGPVRAKLSVEGKRTARRSYRSNAYVGIRSYTEKEMPKSYKGNYEKELRELESVK